MGLGRNLIRFIANKIRPVIKEAVQISEPIIKEAIKNSLEEYIKGQIEKTTSQDNR